MRLRNCSQEEKDAEKAIQALDGLDWRSRLLEDSLASLLLMCCSHRPGRGERWTPCCCQSPRSESICLEHLRNKYIVKFP